jgi:hypothetical protein
LASVAVARYVFGQYPSLETGQSPLSPLQLGHRISWPEGGDRYFDDFQPGIDRRDCPGAEPVVDVEDCCHVFHSDRAV